MQDLKINPEFEEQTSWNDQWDTEKLERLKNAIHAGALHCEAEDEGPED